MKIRSIALALLITATAAAAQIPADTLEVAAATQLAGTDLKTPLFLCRADSWSVVRKAIDEDAGKWLPPVKLFDNLFFVGNRFVGVYIVKSSAGLILFDATGSAADAEQHLVPGLVDLGLDPATIRYVVVTHGHWDHFGGAAWLQQRYKARIALSAADWTLIENTPPTAPEIGEHPTPRRDFVVEDGQKLTLGDTTITLYVTPGHTPGTVSAIVPVRDGRKMLTFSLLGSVAFPATVEPSARAGGLRAYDASVRRFGRISRDRGAVGLLNTHSFADGGLAHLDAAVAGGGGRSLVIGRGAVDRYYDLLDECLKAATLRLQPDAKLEDRAR